MPSGAGTACGSCRIKLEEFFGDSNWQVVQLHKGTELNPLIKSYRLVSGENKPLEPFKPGQFIILKCNINGVWIERSYTLASSPYNTDYYDVVIKRKPNGIMSNWLYDELNQDQLIKISKPQGNFILDENRTTPVIFFAGGIGITPGLCFARTLATGDGNGRLLKIYYNVQQRGHIVFNEELNNYAAGKNNISNEYYIDEERGHLITDTEISKVAQSYSDGDFYICGPAPFQHVIKTGLLSAGVPEKRIYTEEFNIKSI